MVPSPISCLSLRKKLRKTTIKGSELAGATAKEKEALTTRARTVSSHRQAAAAIFFSFINEPRGASLHDKSLVAYGGGGVSSAVGGYLGGEPAFWWNVWLVVIHVALILLVAFAIFKAVRAMKAWIRGDGVVVRGGGGLPPAVADVGSQCEIVHLAGLTTEGLQEECRCAGFRMSGLRAELVARVDNELRRRAN